MEHVIDDRGFEVDYRGVFLMLYIGAWFFATVFIVAGAVLLYGVYYDVRSLQATGGPGTDPSLEQLIRIGIPGALLATGALFLAAAAFGRAESRTGRGLLLIAAIFMMTMRLGSFALMYQALMYQRLHPIQLSSPIGPPAWQLASNISTTLFALTYPLLCIVALYASRPAPRR